MNRRALAPILALAAMAAAALVGTAGAATTPFSSRALAVSRTCTLTGTASSSTVAVETWVDQNAPNTNSGGTTTMFVQANGTKNRRTYLRFDLTRCVPAIPATATVTEAVLRLFMNQISTACTTEDVFRVTSSWGETTITWNNQPFGTAINNPPTGQRTGSIAVGAAPCTNSTNNVYVTGWNVTTDVAAFVAGTATNYGWMIRDDNEGSANHNSRYVTSEANQPTQGPQLIVTYDP